MTNNFVDYKFRAADVPSTCPGGTGACDHTLPDRLADIKNVMDFGALGDGTGAQLSTRYGSLAAAQAVYPFVTSLTQTIDWAAIMGAYNWTTDDIRGTVFFPPGSYVVSDPIDFSELHVIASFVGVLGASTVTGNFADYIFKRARMDVDGTGGPRTVENFTVVNQHAAGGGIRLGVCVGAAIRNCTVIANQALDTASDDFTPGGVTSDELAIENCTLTPGANTSGSRGILSVSDGPILCCSMTGFDTGLTTTGQEGGANVLGCRFELCGIGMDVGTGSTVSGCWFKNCGTAINGVGGSCRYSGICIEAAEGTIAGDPQYGMKLITSGSQRTIFEGIIVTGQFAQYGIDCGDGEIGASFATFIGVQSINTSTMGGLPWRISANAGDAQTAQFINCNVAHVLTMAKIPVTPLGITSISWSGGTTTIAVDSAIGNYIGQPITVTVTGISPSGYNGIFTGALATGTFTLTYSQSNPGGASGSGTGPAYVNASSFAQEGDCYNVSDSSTATWANAPVGGGSTHAKVRWSVNAEWTVVGI